jgi:hypothetical protein
LWIFVVSLMEGWDGMPRSGSVAGTGRSRPPFAVLDGSGAEVEPVSQCLKELALGDCSPLTCRSYASP